MTMAMLESTEATTAPTVLFPPCLLPLGIIEGKVSDAIQARLSTLSADVGPRLERFDIEVISNWTAFAADPSPTRRLNMTGFGQLWEILQYGACHLRDQSSVKHDSTVLKTRCSWCELLLVLWDKTRSDVAMKILVQSWEAILLLPFVEGVRRYDLLLGAFKVYRSRYDASKDRTGFGEARLTVDEMLEIAQPGREQVQANDLRGRLFGIRMCDSLPEDARNFAVRESIQNLTKATEILRTIQEKESSDPHVYNCLAFALTKRFEIEHRKSDIDAAIINGQHAISMITEGSQLWNEWADTLARAYWKKFWEYAQVEDADSGIEIFQHILNIHPDAPNAATGLAELLRQRIEGLVRTNAERRLVSARAIELLESVIVNTSDTDKDMPSRLGRCSSALADRFRSDSIVEDIDVAIALQITAKNLQRPEKRWFHLIHLCDYYILRHNVLNTEEDLACALAIGQECVEAAGSVREKRSECLLQYGCAQATAYQRKQAPEMLPNAIKSMREASRLSTEFSWGGVNIRNVTWRHINILENLARILGLQSGLRGSYDDAAEGIRLVKEAIDLLRKLTGKGNHCREAKCLSTLGELLIARYTRYGAFEDIDETIRACHSSLDATDIEHISYVPRAMSLSHVLGIRYSLLGKNIDFEMAQTLVSSTLDSLQRRIVAPSKTEIALILDQKGMILLQKAVRSEAKEPLDEAIQAFSEAVRLVPGSTAFSHSLATAVTHKAIETPSLENSTLALTTLLKYVGAITTHAPTSFDQKIPAVLHSTAKICLAHSRESPGNEHIEKLTNHILQLLADLKSARPGDKIWAAVELAIRLYQTKDYVVAAKYINIAIEHLPHLAMYGLSRADQLQAILPHSNLPKCALAFNILAEAPLGKSLQLLEQSRSILWDRLLNEHTPILELQAQDAELAQKFDNLRFRLHKPRALALTGDRVDGMAFDVPDQYKDAEDYLSMLNEIRKLPGLGDFLKLKADDQNFTKYAGEGPIVIVNCVWGYGHAVLVTRTGIINLNLPDFSEELAQQVYEKLQESIGQMRKNELDEANSIYIRVLNTLWKTVACPILDKLEEIEFKEYRRTNNKLPRLWWVTNGFMNLLPIHAAGDYLQPHKSETNTHSTVMDRVVSSYIPSFRALEFARGNAATRSENLNPSLHNTLIVSMPQTPNEETLPSAYKEIAAIKPYLPKTLSNIMELEEPTSPEVISMLKTACHAHFICHGAVSATDPTLSNLKLANFRSGKPSSLDVRSILQASMPYLRCVFLSACNTGTTGNMSLKDESLHVSGAFLMRGVPEVVASRWEVADELSVDVAGWFYKSLKDGEGFSGGGDVRNGTVGSARALHEAVRRAKEKGENAMFWGSYAHYGV